MGLFSRGADYWVEKGQRYVDSGKFDKAIECFEKALEKDPRSAVAWSEKGFAHDNLGDFQKGMECYDKSLEIDPNFHPAWNNKAHTLFEQLGKFREALEHVEKALEIRPNTPEYLSLKLRVHRKLGEHKKALKCCNKILSIEPDAPVGLASKRDILKELAARAPHARGLAEEAKYWDEMSRREGKPGEAVKLNEQAGKYRLGSSDALICLDKAVELNPRSAIIWHNKGICHLNRREFQEALKALDKALEIAPDWAVAINHRRLASEKWRGA